MFFGSTQVVSQLDRQSKNQMCTQFSRRHIGLIFRRSCNMAAP